MAGLTGLLAHNLFCVNLRFVSSGFFLWLFMGIISGDYPPAVPVKGKTPSPHKLQDLVKTAVLVITIICLVFYVRFFMADYHHNIGIYFSKMHMWDDAIQEYKTSTELNPFFVMSRYFQGNVYNDRWQPGDDQRALDKYDEVIKMAPNYVMVHYQRGVVYMKTRRYQESIDEFTQALRLDPVYPQTYFRLGMIYIDLKQLDQALDNFKQANRLDPGVADIHVSLGNVYYLQNKLLQSEAEYMIAIELDNKNFNAHRNLGMLYVRQNRRTEALRELNIARRFIPNDAELNRVIEGIRP
jgi:tetratricopeptide (TPR) repeat protein